jgi:hypothetical protein
MWLNANNSQAITINEKDEMMWKILYILAQPSAKQEAQMKTSEEELTMLTTAHSLSSYIDLVILISFSCIP